jgi:hypothetical protein
VEIFHSFVTRFTTYLSNMSKNLVKVYRLKCNINTTNKHHEIEMLEELNLLYRLYGYILKKELVWKS